MLKRFFRFIFGAVGFLLLLGGFSLLAVLATVFVFNRMVERDEVRVPNVINMPTDKAVVLLVKTGLKPHIEEIYDPNMPPGRIVSQQPLPGRGVKRDRTVELVQSSGNPEVVVPRIVGRTLREADVLLAEKELVGGREVRAYNSDYPEGQIFAQRPRAGSTMLKNQPVDMLVSRGPMPVRYRMPNYQGRPQVEAREMISAAGLLLEAIELAHVPSASPEEVVDQSPLPGEPVDSQTPIILEVAAAVDSDARQGYQWLQFELPPTVGAGEVVVLLIDSLGERELIRAPRPADGRLEVVFSPVGDAQILVYQDGVLVGQKFVHVAE